MGYYCHKMTNISYGKKDKAKGRLPDTQNTPAWYAAIWETNYLSKVTKTPINKNINKMVEDHQGKLYTTSRIYTTIHRN